MSDVSPAAAAGWKGPAGAAFAALWGAIGGIFAPVPERGFLEEAAAYSGKLFGSGMFLGLLAAGVTHLLILRGAGKGAKWLTYLAGAIAGSIASMATHG